MGKNNTMPGMYHKEYSHRTQYGFNFTSSMIYMKPTLLYRLNMKNQTHSAGWEPKWLGFFKLTNLSIFLS